MKTESQIRQKLKQARYRRKALYLDGVLKVAAHNCTHNRAHAEPDGGDSFRICIHAGLGSPNRLCGDAPFTLRASGCPLYTPQIEREAAKAHFAAVVAGTPEELSKEGYHDLAALVWVLGEDALKAPEDEPELPAPPELPELVKPELPELVKSELVPVKTPPPAPVTALVAAPAKAWYRRLLWWLD